MKRGLILTLVIVFFCFFIRRIEATRGVRKGRSMHSRISRITCSVTDKVAKCFLAKVIKKIINVYLISSNPALFPAVAAGVFL